MGHIRERNLKNVGVRYQAEVCLKGHPCLTAMFDRKTKAKNWIQKVEADIHCGRHPIYEIQVLTYLRLTGIKLGLLVNFGAPYLKDGVSRIINGVL
jgi:hypothetical protein